MKKYLSSKYGAEIDQAVTDVPKIKLDIENLKKRLQNISIAGTKELTQAEYYALQTKEKFLYFIVNNNVLERIYYHNTVIAYRDTEAKNHNMAFPLTFPIVFG